MVVLERLRILAARPAFWAAGYAIWAVTLYIVSSIQGVPGPSIPHIDKVEHAVFFAAGHLVLGMAWVVGRGNLSRSKWMRIAFALTLCACVVGILDEYHQSFTPGRNGNDPGDIIADTFGGLIAGLLLPKARAWTLALLNRS